MSYTTANITKFDDVAHTRLKPGVNLGRDPMTTGLRELIDNAIEEVSLHGGTTVTITLHVDGSVTVADDGRGLPVDFNAEHGQNGIVMTLGSARAGGKFDAHTDAEHTGAGTHGIGAAAAIFISKRTDVTVRRDGKTYRQSFGEGYPGTFAGSVFDPDASFTRVDDMKLRGAANGEPQVHGTSVRILFDRTVVPDMDLDIEQVLMRAHAAARMSPNAQLRIVDEGWPGAPIRPDLLELFSGPWGTDAVLDFVCAYGSTPVPAVRASIDGRGTYTTGRGSTPFRWSLAAGPAEPTTVSAFCNTVYTVNGGSHLTAAVKGMTEALAERAGRIRDLGLAKGEAGPEPQDFAAVTSMALDTRAPDVDWDSQAKVSMTSRTLNVAMAADVQRSVTVWAASPANSATVTAWAKLALVAARARRSAEGAKARSRAESKAKGLGTNFSLPEKLIPSRETGRGSGAEVLICEGGSAKSTIKSARDSNTQAVYDIRGKTLNPWTMSVEKARSNAEFGDIEKILGCGIGASTDPEACRFDMIIACADADPDGMGINSQLAMIMSRFYRPLVKAGMFFVAVPPLHVVEWSGLRMYCTTDADKDGVLAALRIIVGLPDPETGQVLDASASDLKSARDAVLAAVSSSETETARKALAAKRPSTTIKVNRCKGLGEMNSEDFHATVLDPATRTLIQLVVEDDDELDKFGDLLFGPAKFAADRRAWMSRGYDRDDTGISVTQTGIAAEIVRMSVVDFWDRDYRTYAEYTVSSRAVPHADSGLKPVQQRILYAASVMGATPTGEAPKTQKLASVVSGDYHPHGDASVSTTAALMAAHYQRVELLDGKGAFPVSTGDTPASPRYTHARLSTPGYELVRDLREAPVVPMVPTYDNRHTEPVTLPSRFPALLTYGCPGGSMAIGWSSTIPAHNPRDVITAARALLANRDLMDDDLIATLVGPDWGSGGVVVGGAGIRDYMTTGKGNITVSGKLHVDGKNVVITELPPGVSIYTPPSGDKPAGGVLGTLRNGVLSGAITGVSDAADLTGGKNGVEIRVTCKRGTHPDEVIRQIRELTPFEGTFAAQLVALDGDQLPQFWNVRGLLLRFLDMRDSVVLRRYEHRGVKARERQHLVRGMIAVLADIDETIRIIQGCDTDAEVHERLGERFGIDQVQSEYVLSLQLRKLKRLDQLELSREDEKLTKDIATSDKHVSSRAARRKVIDAELVETAKLFSGPEYDRRTTLDFNAVPAAVQRAEREKSDGKTERTVNRSWRLDDRGVFSDSHGDLLCEGIGWAVWTNGTVKFTDGKGLPSRTRDVPVAPNMDGLLVSGVLPAGAHLALVTRRGKILRIDPSTVNPQGAAGNGVAGVKLADTVDAVIAALPLSGTAGEAILSTSEKGWKVTAVDDLPVKGRGGSGVGFHPFITGEDAIISAVVSPAGFVRGSKPVRAEKRAKATVKGAAADVTPAASQPAT